MEKQYNTQNITWCKQHNDSILLSLIIQPGSKFNQVIGVVGEELKIKIRAAAIEDKANIELIKYLSELLAIPKSKIIIKRGHNSRHKIVEIAGYGQNIIKSLTNLFL